MSTTINATMNTSGQYDESIGSKIERLWEQVKEQVEKLASVVSSFFSMSTIYKIMNGTPNWVIYFVGYIGLWLYTSLKAVGTSGALVGVYAAVVCMALYYMCVFLAYGVAWNVAIATAMFVAIYLGVYLLAAIMVISLALTAYYKSEQFVNILRSIVMARCFFTT